MKIHSEEICQVLIENRSQYYKKSTKSKGYFFNRGFEYILCIFHGEPEMLEFPDCQLRISLTQTLGLLPPLTIYITLVGLFTSQN